MALYKVVGTTRPNIDWTSEVVLERDRDGNVKKSVGTKPVDLTQNEVQKVEALGIVLEKVSKEEAEEAEAQAAVGADVAQAGPVFGSSDVSNQGV